MPDDMPTVQNSVLLVCRMSCHMFRLSHWSDLETKDKSVQETDGLVMMNRIQYES